MSKFGKRDFSRRLFLTGAAGVTVGLPFLETFAPRSVRAAGPDDPGFVVFMRQGNGCSQAMQYSNPAEPEMFWPRNLGALTAASMAADGDRALSELSAHADKLLLVRGVRGAFSIGGCGHARGALQALTAQPANRTRRQHLPQVAKEPSCLALGGAKILDELGGTTVVSQVGTQQLTIASRQLTLPSVKQCVVE